jgi:hypothetical protein
VIDVQVILLGFNPLTAIVPVHPEDKVMFGVAEKPELVVMV